MLTYADLNLPVFRALCACLGLDPEDSNPTLLVLQAYPQNDTLPQLYRNRDVIFYDLQPEKGTDSAYTETEWRKGQEIRIRIRPMILRIYSYGPHADRNAYQILTGFFSDAGSDSPRSILRAANLIPVKNPPEPQTIYETEGTLWRKRTDLSISLRSRMEFRADCPTLLLTPDLIPHPQP